LDEHSTDAWDDAIAKIAGVQVNEDIEDEGSDVIEDDDDIDDE
jgi:hypothetical protein